MKFEAEFGRLWRVWGQWRAEGNLKEVELAQGLGVAPCRTRRSCASEKRCSSLPLLGEMPAERLEVVGAVREEPLDQRLVRLALALHVRLQRHGGRRKVAQRLASRLPYLLEFGEVLGALRGQGEGEGQEGGGGERACSRSGSTMAGSVMPSNAMNLSLTDAFMALGV